MHGTTHAHVGVVHVEHAQVGVVSVDAHGIAHATMAILVDHAQATATVHLALGHQAAIHGHCLPEALLLLLLLLKLLKLLLLLLLLLKLKL